MGESIDKGAYRIAVATVGCALIVVLAGLCVIVAVGIKEVPHELWLAASGLSGGLLGIIAPSPGPSSATKEKPPPQHDNVFVRGFIKVGRGLAIVGKDFWSNRAIGILLIVFLASVVVGAIDYPGPKHADSMLALAAASGGALIGMLAPPPAKASQ
jgi:hypothetical protein